MRGIQVLACLMLVHANAIGEHLSNAEQLISEVSTLLTKGAPDKKIARRVEEACLTDSLTDRLIDELLKKYRVGPRTMFALEMQARKSLYLKAPADTAPADPDPDTATLGIITDRLRRYVDRSLASWTKFVATTAETRFTNQ